MSKSDKLLQRVRNSPKSVSFADLDSLLIAYGFELRRSRGSHHIYSHTEYLELRITVPFKRPHVGATYVRWVLALIEQLENG
ncbi:MAG: type II toxin-antitoxin system HicA family toxin [Caldilineaceae bacterium]|nr:type II toxin-antitoxin system HicA family toxin [Caldilineaceae bacterium]